MNRLDLLFFAPLFFFSLQNQALDASNPKVNKDKIKLITLNPGHFHAALIQKYPIDQLDTTVYVYGKKGTELDAHLSLIHSYNQRTVNPTHWNEIVYTGNDFFKKMLQNKKGNVIVLAGNNKGKTDYIEKSVGAGLNVLADKPMAINSSGFLQLKKAFQVAKQKQVLICDIMTERYDVLNILQRTIMQDTLLFGSLLLGTKDEPSVIMESIHSFYKEVSGKPLIRPAWYYDTEQQGEGIVDVTTHLIDLAHWKCFPDISLDYKKDIRLIKAEHWPTKISTSEFQKSTAQTGFPDYLKKYVKDSVLNVFANGSISYQVRNVNVKVMVIWNFEAPKGSGDIQKTIIRGSKATLMILQDKAQAFIPTLYVQKADNVTEADFQQNLKFLLLRLRGIYPEVTLSTENNGIEIIVPEKYKTGHEANFSAVVTKFIHYLDKSQGIPAWEIPNMIAKYYITTTALKMAQKQNAY
jgi:predicted dehydrogenase